MKTVIATALMTLGVCLVTSRAQADTLFDSTGGGMLLGGDFLLDNGSIPGTFRIVTGPNILGGLTVFQPFVVTGPGWNVTTIGVDGWNIFDPGGLGMLGTLLPDDGGSPDEANPIASSVYHLGDDPSGSNWQDESFDVTLTPGMYWMMWEDNGANFHWSMIFHAPEGLPSFSRFDGGFEFPGPPTALRIDGTEIPAPGALGLFVIAMGAARRKRRRTT